MDYQLVNDLQTSYREGTISLAEFLAAIQIYRDGSRQYIEQLSVYYKTIFKLEVLNGKQLVTF